MMLESGYYWVVFLGLLNDRGHVHRNNRSQTTVLVLRGLLADSCLMRQARIAPGRGRQPHK